MTKQNIQFIPLEKLELDKANPRLPSKFKRGNLTKSDIVNWMLGDASIIELMLAIGNSGFFYWRVITCSRRQREVCRY